MPFARREVTVTFPIDCSSCEPLEKVAADAVGTTLEKRGWSFLRLATVAGEPFTATAIFCRRGERDRDFDATTAKQWPTIERRFAVAASAIGWSSDLVLTPVVESSKIPVTVTPGAATICKECGCDNDGYKGNCFVCGASREQTVTDDSELRSLIAAVKTAVANLETYLENRNGSC